MPSVRREPDADEPLGESGSVPAREPRRSRSLAERARGGRLFMREGSVVARTVEVAEESEGRRGAPDGRRDRVRPRSRGGLAGALAARGIALHMHPGNAVVEPGEAVPPGKHMYSVFTPYHRAWVQVPRRSVLPAPTTVIGACRRPPRPAPRPRSISPDAIDLAPGGESAGRKHLEAFLARAASTYGDHRNDMAADATSRVSPYLRFGCISANEMAADAGAIVGAEELVRQLAWRDFYGQLLANDPAIQWRDYRERRRPTCPTSPTTRTTSSNVGVRDGRDCRSSTPGCDSFVVRGGCTTGPAWWWPRS